MRATVRKLAGILAAYKVGNPGFTPVFACSAVGTDKQLKVQSTVKVDGGAPVTIAADNGKIKTFSDVDAAIQAFSKISESNNGVYSLSVDTGALFASKVPTNMVSAAESKIIALTKTKANQTAQKASLDADLVLMAGWDTGNAAQQARFAEVTAQSATVADDIGALTAELARLALIVG